MRNVLWRKKCGHGFYSTLNIRLFFFGALLVGFSVGAQPECRDIDGTRYCNVEFWIGTSTLIGEARVSSLPSGEVTIIEENHCPANHNGGYLGKVQQGSYDHFTNAILVDGEIWGEYPPGYPPRIESQKTGQILSSSFPNIQLIGQTVTYKNIFSPAMHWYDLQCTYYNCTTASVCGLEITYLIGINAASSVDLALGAISIPGATINVSDGLPVIPVGVQTQVNVPVSISFMGALSSTVLNSSVPVTLQVGSYSSTQNVSIASLVANQNQILVPFLVTLQSSDVGLKTIIANVNAGNSVVESNHTNNVAQLNVHVGEGYNLNVSVLDLTNKNLCKTLVGPDDGTYCQSGDIRDGSVLNVPFGAHLNFELRDKAGQIIPATYQLFGALGKPDDPDSVTSPPEKIEQEDYSLYPNKLAVLFDQDAQKNSQSFITVHMGKQKLKITPLAGMAPVTVVLHSFGAKIGEGNNFYDKLIRGRAHKIGLPPQYIKGEILQEAGGSFDAGAYRYEPKENDLELIQPKLVTIAGILKFDTKDYKYNVENIRYNKYLFRHTDRLLSKEDSLNSKQKEQINKRSLYYVKFNNEPKKIPLDYETTIKPNEYTPLYISDVASANTTENWKMSQSEISSSKNKVAQTIISASYGLWQILYTTAVEEAGFGEPGGAGVIYTAGKDPRLLFDPKINLLHGGFYLNKCIKEVNKLQVAKVNPLMSIDQFNTHVKLGYAGYNAGLGHENIAYPDFNEDYRDKTFAKVKKFTILLSNEIF